MVDLDDDDDESYQLDGNTDDDNYNDGGEDGADIVAQQPGNGEGALVDEPVILVVAVNDEADDQNGNDRVELEPIVGSVEQEDQGEGHVDQEDLRAVDKAKTNTEEGSSMGNGNGGDPMDGNIDDPVEHDSGPTNGPIAGPPNPRPNAQVQCELYHLAIDRNIPMLLASPMVLVITLPLSV